DYSGGQTGEDILKFTDVKFTDVKFTRDLDDLLLWGYSDGDSVRIKSFFSNAYYEIEQFAFADQTVTMQDFKDKGMTFHGTSGSDTINVWTGKSHALGGDGNDILNGNSGIDYLEGGSG
ncbi:calcium-binding protein, partial [Acinetobacter gyllenbergii]|uniref:calcium-binding protein n=1 Tax=Acinetobacter gyllenbergii TaxID=134534 RepID=UPI003F568E49